MRTYSAYLVVFCVLVSSVRLDGALFEVSAKILSPGTGEAVSAPFLVRIGIQLDSGREAIEPGAVVEVIAYRNADECGEGDEIMLVEHQSTVPLLEGSELRVWTGHHLEMGSCMICAYVSHTSGVLLSSASSRIVVASEHGASDPNCEKLHTGVELSGHLCSSRQDLGVRAVLDKRQTENSQKTRLWTWEERLESGIRPNGSQVLTLSMPEMLGGSDGVHVAHIRCRACQGSDARELMNAFLREQDRTGDLKKLFSSSALQKFESLSPPISTQRSDNEWDGCLAALSARNIAEQMQSSATVLVVGNLLLPGADDELPGADDEHPEIDWIPTFRFAKWIVDDVTRFMQQHLSSRPSLCVAFIVSHVDHGANAGRRDPSNAHRLRRRSFGAEGLVLVDSVRRLERRLERSFGAVYLVSDFAAHEEALLLAGELNATSYRGLLTSARLGDPAVDGHVRDAMAARDMEVCSRTDYFLSNDVPELLDCGHWATQVRARRAANAPSAGRRDQTRSADGRRAPSSHPGLNGRRSTSADYFGRWMVEHTPCAQVDSITALPPNEEVCEHSATRVSAPTPGTASIEEWLRQGRRPGEFVGALLQVETGACTQPSLFGGSMCDDGGKVLCVTERLMPHSKRNEPEHSADAEAAPQQGSLRDCVVYSFGVGFDRRFEDAVLRRTACKVFLFDPTPEVVEFMSRVELSDRATFLPWGIAKEGGQGTLEVRDATSMSRPATMEDGAREEHQVQFRTLKQVMQQLGHQRVSVLKMDVEGMEFEVLDQVESHDTGIEQLVVEMHATIPNERASNPQRALRWAEAHAQLQSYGFSLFHANEQAYFCPGLSYHSCTNPRSDGVLMEMSYIRRIPSDEACASDERRERWSGEIGGVPDEERENAGAGERMQRQNTGRGAGPLAAVEKGGEERFVLPLLESAMGEFGQRLAGLEAACKVARVLQRQVLLPPSSTLHLLLER